VATQIEHLIEQFSAWEQRGRGWQVWPRPVALEPAFRPFLGYDLASPDSGVDEGRRQTWLSALAAWMRSLWGQVPPPAPVPESDDEDPYPEPNACGAGLTTLRMLLPRSFEIAPQVSEQLLGALAGMAFPVAFEIVATPEQVVLQLTADRLDARYLRQHFAVFAPDVGLAAEPDLLAANWVRRSPAWVVEFGLANEFLRPLQRLSAFKVDPLTPLISSLLGLEDGQVAVLQVLVQAAGYPWAESALRALYGTDGRPLGFLPPDLAAQAKQKLAKPLVAAVIRVGVQSADSDQALHLLARIGTSLSPLSVPLGQELMPLSNDGYDEALHRADLLERRTQRSGMLLNVEELSSLVHLPGSAITHAKFARFTKVTKAAPAAVIGHDLILGTNAHLGQQRPVTLSQQQRLRHVYAIGASGTGKSTLLLSMIEQDLEAGHGLIVLEPHGDLADSVLGRMPQKRVSDVVLLDPADEAFPIGFNVLAAHSELERTLLASDLVGIFRRLSTSWGDQMNSVFSNAILAFLESEQGGTLLELRRFLVDSKYRAAYLPSVRDPEIAYYWQKEFPLLKGNPQAPILTRLDAFLRPKLIRNMVGQRENRLDFRAIMDEGRVVIARLSHGAIGEENAYLLGALLVAKIHQSALSRQDQTAHSRRDFFLYADEFHHFATPSMASILSGVRKYGLGLVLAHQDLRQLGGRTDEIASAALTNAATRIVFRVGDDDARHLAQGFAAFDAHDLQSLSVGEAVCRVERADNDFNLTTRPIGAADESAARRAAAVRKASRQRYGTPVEQLQPPSPAVVVEESPAPAAAPDYVPPLTRAAPAPAPAAVLKRMPAASTSPGRGGQQHKYLQSLIQNFGEDRGFRASVEESVLDGHGSVDVALIRGALRVAVEITVTTPTAHELGNIAKCLAAGFDQVVVVPADRKAIKRLVAAVRKALPPDVHDRVHCLDAEGVPAFLDGLPVPETEVQTVAGYKVNTRVSHVGQDEQRRRAAAVRDVIGRSLNRLGGSEKKE
jgi:hypothetical protein